MVKFFKPGKVVVILNGRYAGRKGIILRSNYENSKERKYPHCQILGLSKGPRKATKRSLKRLEDRIKNLEKAQSANATERLNKLKTLGIFIKTYNMSHLLVTRYTVREDFSAVKCIEKLDIAENQMKESKVLVKKKEAEKKEENAKALEDLKKQLGTDTDNYKTTLRNVKLQIGSEMYSRFMQGFVSGTTPEEKEKDEQTHFLFKKLNF